MERWHKIDFCNYSVSDEGRVRNDKSGLILKICFFSDNGRPYVSLPFNRRFKNYSIHRFVAKYFIDNPNSYPEVNHIDGNPTNNNYSNLEWCTRLHNMQHARRTGLITPKKIADGLNRYYSTAPKRKYSKYQCELKSKRVSEYYQKNPEAKLAVSEKMKEIWAERKKLKNTLAA